MQSKDITKLDRSSYGVHSFEAAEAQVKLDLEQISVAQRFEMITYLREQFYGPSATTGRLSRVYTASPHK